MSQSDEIIPVYCFNEATYQTTEYGFKKTGKFRFKFICESLMDLDKSLRERGSGLMVMKGDPSQLLFQLAEAFQVSTIFAKREIAPEEVNLQKRIQQNLSQINCDLDACNSGTLYRLEDLYASPQQIPDVFTVFRKQIEGRKVQIDLLPSPDRISSPSIPDMILPTYEEMGLDLCIDDPRAAILFTGGESAGIKRLHTYFHETHAIASYKETRNGMIGENYSSKFSAWLALGCLSPRYIYHELKKYEKEHGANDSTYWLFFELLWREFFMCMMRKYQAKLFFKNGIRTQALNDNMHDAAVFDTWKHGKTIHDFINANMRELKYTGFMSNRGRQNVASYLVNELKLDWRYGAAYFEEQLIDYDVSSNWGNWAYLAGVGHDPRGHRIFNIDKQAEQYDTDKSYRKLWLKKL
jgi:deoxyribodipyrimidine photo-lyase